MNNQSNHNTRIGQILLAEGLIGERQLARALFLQAHRADYRPLGEILAELGFISRRRFHDVLLRYRKQIPLGELLVKMGIISSAQLLAALKQQEGGKKKLGESLVEMKVVTRSQLVDGLCLQLGIDKVDGETNEANKELLTKVSLAFLREKRVVPLGYHEDTRVMRVLMEDPTDRETIADLEKTYKTGVEAVMLRSGTIEHLLDGILDIWHLAR